MRMDKLKVGGTYYCVFPDNGFDPVEFAKLEIVSLNKDSIKVMCRPKHAVWGLDKYDCRYFHSSIDEAKGAVAILHKKALEKIQRDYEKLVIKCNKVYNRVIKSIEK